MFISVVVYTLHISNDLSKKSLGFKRRSDETNAAMSSDDEEEEVLKVKTYISTEYSNCVESGSQMGISIADQRE